MNMMNEIGPSIDPWGIPNNILVSTAYADQHSSKSTD